MLTTQIGTDDHQPSILKHEHPSINLPRKSKKSHLKIANLNEKIFVFKKNQEKSKIDKDAFLK